MIRTEDKSLALLSEPAWTDQSYATPRAGDVDFPELRAPAHPCITHATASSRGETTNMKHSLWFLLFRGLDSSLPLKIPQLVLMREQEPKALEGMSLLSLFRAEIIIMGTVVAIAAAVPWSRFTERGARDTKRHFHHSGPRDTRCSLAFPPQLNQGTQTGTSVWAARMGFSCTTLILFPAAPPLPTLRSGSGASRNKCWERQSSRTAGY